VGKFRRRGTKRLGTPLHQEGWRQGAPRSGLRDLLGAGRAHSPSGIRQQDHFPGRDSRSTTRVDLAARADLHGGHGQGGQGEGMTAADIDGAARSTSCGNAWFKYTGRANSSQPSFGDQVGRIAVGQLKEGGAAEVVIGPGDRQRAARVVPSAWVIRGSAARGSAQADSTATWLHGHSLALGDIDGEDISTSWRRDGQVGRTPQIAATGRDGLDFLRRRPGQFRTTELVKGHGFTRAALRPGRRR